MQDRKVCHVTVRFPIDLYEALRGIILEYDLRVSVPLAIRSVVLGETFQVHFDDAPSKAALQGTRLRQLGALEETLLLLLESCLQNMRGMRQRVEMDILCRTMLLLGLCRKALKCLLETYQEHPECLKEHKVQVAVSSLRLQSSGLKSTQKLNLVLPLSFLKSVPPGQSYTGFILQRFLKGRIRVNRIPLYALLMEEAMAQRQSLTHMAEALEPRVTSLGTQLSGPSKERLLNLLQSIQDDTQD